MKNFRNVILISLFTVVATGLRSMETPPAEVTFVEQEEVPIGFENIPTEVQGLILAGTIDPNQSAYDVLRTLYRLRATNKDFKKIIDDYFINQGVIQSPDELRKYLTEGGKLDTWKLKKSDSFIIFLKEEMHKLWIYLSIS